MFIIYIILILKQITSVFSVCTVNNDYNKAVTSLNGIELCYNGDCTLTTNVLKNNDNIETCREPGSPTVSQRPMLKIEIYLKTNNGNVKKKCLLPGGVWADITRLTKCGTDRPLKFIPYANLNAYEIYVVTCGPQEQEFPDEGLPRVQIAGMDYYQDPLTSTPILLFPTQQLECVSNCAQIKVAWTATTGGNLVDFTEKLTMHIMRVKSFQMTQNDIQTYVKLLCSDQNNVKKSVSFYIADFINGSIFSYTENKNRTPSNTYDAGETINCQIMGFNTFFKNTSGLTPKSNVGILSKDSYGNAKKLNTGSQSSLVIPENLTNTAGGLSILCYIGNYESNDTNAYKEVGVYPFVLGSRFSTKLLINNIAQSADLYDFNPGDRVMCHSMYYQNMTPYSVSSMPIYILYTTYYSFPLSQLSNYLNRKWDNESQELFFIKKYENMTMFAFCLFLGEITTPIQVYAGDRPKLDFTYVHPQWKTEYQLIGFIIICNGSFIDDISFSCVDCLPNTEMEVIKLDQFHMQLTVSKKSRKSIQLNYKCIGFSVKYTSVIKELKLNIIVTDMTDIDMTGLFFLYGSDYLQCRSYFTVTKNGRAEKESILMPAQVQIDGLKTINENGSSQSILLIRDNEPILNPNRMVTFQACCPPYRNKKYSCLGQWRALNVARNFHVDYSLSLDNVFPGNLLKCFICVNFTSEIKIVKCQGENSVNSKIKLRVTDPIGNVTETEWTDEVRAPIEQLKPDQKEYYKISDYKVEVGCLSRGPAVMTVVPMKSCNSDPPRIKISPPDKTMFVVGDIFSCTTDNVNCKSGLKYSITVQRGSETALTKDSHSFMFQKENKGNNIKIKCEAGDAKQKKDERIVRVEIGPYNVSIKTVFPVMQYKQFFQCLSKGFPPPSIIWTQLDGGSTLRISESFLLIGPWDYPGRYVIQCEAKNKRGSVSKTASFQIFNPRITYTDYSSTFYIIVPLLTVAYLILLVLSLFFIFQELLYDLPSFLKGSTPKPSTKPSKATSAPSKTVSKMETSLSTARIK